MKFRTALSLACLWPNDKHNKINHLQAALSLALDEYGSSCLGGKNTSSLVNNPRLSNDPDPFLTTYNPEYADPPKLSGKVDQYMAVELLHLANTKDFATNCKHDKYLHVFKILLNKVESNKS